MRSLVYEYKIEVNAVTFPSVITPTSNGLRKPVIVPAVLLMPITIPDTPGAISKTFTSYPECNNPERATPTHILATAIFADVLYPEITINVAALIAPMKTKTSIIDTVLVSRLHLIIHS